MVYSALIVSLQGMNMDALEQLWSVIVSIVLYVEEGGCFVMKLSVMVLKGFACGFVVMGKSGGFGFVGLFLRD